MEVVKAHGNYCMLALVSHINGCFIGHGTILKSSLAADVKVGRA